MLRIHITFTFHGKQKITNLIQNQFLNYIRHSLCNSHLNTHKKFNLLLKVPNKSKLLKLVVVIAL